MGALPLKGYHDTLRTVCRSWLVAHNCPRLAIVGLLTPTFVTATSSKSQTTLSALLTMKTGELCSDGHQPTVAFCQLAGCPVLPARFWPVGRVSPGAPFKDAQRP